MDSKYRRCVGMMILNASNEILVGRRLDHPSGYWQMPQGGIDQNENPQEAVWREMKEEIGTNKAKIIKVSSDWLKYDIPKKTLETLPWGKKYTGQNGLNFGINNFGKSAPYKEIYNHFNLNVESIVNKIKKKL